jgi:hypothetical protein
MRANISSFAKIFDARDQVTRVNQDPMRDRVLVVVVTAVVIRGGGKRSRKRINPRT